MEALGGSPLAAEEIRVLGALVEKDLITPQAYPLTLNSLVAACNQSSNRHPVVAYEPYEVEAALRSLRERQLIRVVHPSHGDRSTKYRHVLDEALRLDPRTELGILAVLALRGPQTPGELKTRTERMADLDDLAAVEAVLADLATGETPLVLRLERQPGQKESRWAHLLSGAPDPAELVALAAMAAMAVNGGPLSAAGPTQDRLDALEAEVARLATQVAELRTALGLDPPAL